MGKPRRFSHRVKATICGKAIPSSKSRAARNMFPPCKRSTELQAKGIPMGEIKSYPGLTGSLCDGKDPEGNVFQLAHIDPPLIALD